jgi:hypothetical protein
MESLTNLNDVLAKGSIGNSENFNFLESVMDAMKNLQTKEKGCTPKSKSQVVNDTKSPIRSIPVQSQNQQDFIQEGNQIKQIYILKNF